MKKSQLNAISRSYALINYRNAERDINDLKELGLNARATFIWNNYKNSKTISKNCLIIKRALKNHSLRELTGTPTKTKLAQLKKELKK